MEKLEDLTLSEITLAGEVVKTQQQNPGFGDALVMAMH